MVVAIVDGWLVALIRFVSMWTLISAGSVRYLADGSRVLWFLSLMTVPSPPFV